MAFLASTPTVALAGQVAFPVSFPLSPVSGVLTGRQQVNVYAYPTGSAGSPGAPKVVGVDFNWTSDGIITFVSPPGAGMTVEPRRATKINALTKSTVSGGALRAADLAANDTQLLYLEQERSDMDAILQAEIDAKNAILQAEIDGKASHDDLAVLAGYAALAIPDSTGGVYPEQMTPPAVGDGVTNDTLAFQALAAFINASSGGTIILRPGATYLVGRQSLVNVAPDMWAGEEVLTLDGLTRGVTIRCNGAKFKLASGLKFGTFNAAGAPTAHALPFSGSERSYPTPEGIITIKNCTGPVVVNGGLELDGNDAGLVWGGPYGDTGWQLPADGLFLQNNTGGETIGPIYTHHHGRDGYLIFGGNDPTTASSPRNNSWFKGVRSEFNNRQGLSLVGGRGYTFESCRFSDTGQSPYAPGAGFSAPGAGCDLEAESGLIRDIHFIDCEFTNNSGAGLISDSGDVARVKCDSCTFIGSTNWCLWTTKPGFVFEDCLFAGCIAYALANPDLAKATNFIRCTFSDDPALSPLGSFYGGRMFTLTGSGNALLDRCTFDCHTISPFDTSSGVGPIVRDCTINVANPTTLGAMVAARFQGRNVITSPASSEAALGTYVLENPSALLFNGNEMGKGSVVFDPASIANNAQLTTTVNVRGAKIGDYAEAAFSLSLAGLRIHASVTTSGGAGTNGVVTVTLSNNTGGAVDLASGTLRAAVRSAAA